VTEPSREWTPTDCACCRRPVLPGIGRIEDVYLLRAIHEGLKRVNTPEELRRIYQAPS
jgi:hypothetical protein